MSLAFDNKLILITGAASGIGRATAIALSKLGAQLALADINPAGLIETQSLCAPPKRHFVAYLDISDSDAVKKYVEAVIHILGKIDHVFNCAGINPTKLATAEITDEYFEKMMGCNLKGMSSIQLFP